VNGRYLDVDQTSVAAIHGRIEEEANRIKEEKAASKSQKKGGYFKDKEF
jgi:hypothetical protein